MSDPISAVGGFITTIDLFRKSQGEVQSLTEQLNTGKKSTSLQGYGANAPTILDLNASLSATQAYAASATQVSTYLGAYDTTLDQLGKDSTSLQTALDSLNVSDPTSLQSLTSLITGLQVDVTATLNTQVGNRFLYSGTRYTTQPVVNLTTLAPPAAPAAFVAVTPNAVPPSPLPAYDTGSPGTDPANQAYATQTANLSDTQQLGYGITSNDPVIQQLVYSLRRPRPVSPRPSPSRASSSPTPRARSSP
jgi:flagellin-like hook-associated protein FlgL